MKAAPAPKICRRCKAMGKTKARPTWTCRSCGAACCEHLCALKAMSGGPGLATMAIATCGTCRRR